MVIVSCDDCGNAMTPEEMRYYGSRCDHCERAWSKRMNDWRHGRTVEPELDHFYGKPARP